PITSRVTTDHRPAGPASDAADLIEVHSPAQPIASRIIREAIVAFPDRRGARRSGRLARLRPPLVLADRVRPPDDPPPIEIGLNAPGGRDELRVAGDRPRQPVDVGRLERRDLAERVAAELAEWQLVVPGRVDGWQRRRPEAADTVSLERAAGMARPGW